MLTQSKVMLLCDSDSNLARHTTRLRLIHFQKLNTAHDMYCIW